MRSGNISVQLEIRRDSGGLSMDILGLREGARLKGSVEWTSRPLFLESGDRTTEEALRLPEDFFFRFDQALSSATWPREGPHSTGPVPLAVYVQPPEREAETAWEEAVERLLAAEVDLDRVEVIRLGPLEKRPRLPFRLPLRVLGFGSESIAAFGPLETLSWYRDDNDVRDYGLHFSYAQQDDDLVHRLYIEGPQDIIITDEKGLDTFLQISAGLLARPRLLILLDRTGRTAEWATANLPEGMALLHLPAAHSPDEFLKTFILGIVHDYPLHEAIRAAKRTSQDAKLKRQARLRATPQSNQSLRMAESLDQLQVETLIMTEQFALGEIDQFLDRIGPEKAELLRPSLSAAIAFSEPVLHAANLTRALKGDFSREAFGLRPMASAEAAMARARSSGTELRRLLEPLVFDPDLAETVGRAQERRVDIVLEEFDKLTDIYRPFDPDFQSTLGCGMRYRLSVHIGHRRDYSVMVGEVPPIDPLLPEPEFEREGHHLDVVLFETDFELLSPRLQRLYLPPLGGSKPVFFEVRSPDDAGCAVLRVGLYHRNHLVQSFLLEANVQPERAYGRKRQVRSRLVLARSARFTNFDDLGPRALVLAVNRQGNGKGSTHTFMLKKDEVAESIRLPERLLEEQVQKFRELLEKEGYVVENGRKISRFDNEAVPGTPPSAEFAIVVRRLADFGGALYRQIYASASRELKAKLRALAATDTGREEAAPVIQVVRHDANFAFPWPILYDYPLPRKLLGTTPSPVCMGAPLDAGVSAAAASGRYKGCPHNPGRDVYCVEGFWSVRHPIEQIIETGDELTDVTPRVPPPSGHQAVCLVRGIHNAYTDALATALREKIGGALAEIGPKDDLLSLLWDPQRRPALLVLIAHLETAARKDEPEGPRIIPFPKEAWPHPSPIPPEKWLQEVAIFNHEIAEGPWDKPPRPVLLLIACESAATEITSLNDFVKSFTSAGAGAIVGTECEIFSSLGARFAREIALDLWRGDATLGEAIRRFNRRLLSSGNPMAFAFSCFGNADIQLAG